MHPVRVGIPTVTLPPRQPASANGTHLWLRPSVRLWDLGKLQFVRSEIDDRRSTDIRRPPWDAPVVAAPVILWDLGQPWIIQRSCETLHLKPSCLEETTGISMKRLDPIWKVAGTAGYLLPEPVS